MVEALSLAAENVSTGQSEQTKGASVMFQNCPAEHITVVVVVVDDVVGRGSPVEILTTLA